MPLISSNLDLGNKLCEQKIIQKVSGFKQHQPNSCFVDHSNYLIFEKIPQTESQRTRKVNKPKVSISQAISQQENTGIKPSQLPLIRNDGANRFDSLVKDTESKLTNKGPYQSRVRTEIGRETEQRFPISRLIPPAFGNPPIVQTIYGSTIDMETYLIGLPKVDNRSTKDTGILNLDERTSSNRVYKTFSQGAEFRDPILYQTDPISSIPMTEHRTRVENNEEAYHQAQENAQDFLSSSQMFTSLIQNQTKPDADLRIESKRSLWSGLKGKATKSFRTPGDLTTKPSTIAESCHDLTARLNTLIPRDQFIYTEENPNPERGSKDILKSELSRGFMESQRDNQTNSGSIEFYQPTSQRGYEGSKNSHQSLSQREKSKKVQQVTFQKRKDSTTSNASRQSKYSNEGWRIENINKKIETQKKLKDELSHGLMMTSTGNLYGIFLKG